MSFSQYTKSIQGKGLPEKGGSDVIGLEKKRKLNQKSRALAKRPISLPQPSVSDLGPYISKTFRYHRIPCNYAVLDHPDTHYPPTITVTAKGLEKFPELLQRLSQLGRHYGALKLKLPPIETGKSWFDVPSAKPLSTIKFEVREQVFEDLESNAVHGNKAYRVASLKSKKAMSLWHTHMVKKIDYQLIGSMDTFWGKVEKEVEKDGHSKPRFYGVDIEVDQVCMDQSRTPLFEQPFNLLLTPGLPLIPGITTPYVYFGQPGTAFSWHVEDYHCHSSNTLLDGAPKIWHVIPGACMQRFVTQVKATIPGLELNPCPQALRHEGFVMSAPPLNPQQWTEAGYACHQFVQEKGEMMVVWPGAYHSGINSGWNLAEAMNFATEDWIEEGRKYQPCNCDCSRTEPIVLDLDLIQKTVENGGDVSGSGGKRMKY